MARNDGIDRVFDVSKPSRVSPNPTSKPVIVGHQPMMSDPMVTDEHRHEPAKVTSVPVMTDEGPLSQPLPKAKLPAPAEAPTQVSSYLDNINPVASDPIVAPTTEQPKPRPMEEKTPLFSSVDSLIGEHHDHHQNLPETSVDNDGPIANTPLSNPHGAGPRRSWGKMITWLILVAVVIFGIYGFVDAKTSVKLPFYIFRKTAPVAAPAPAPPSSPPAPAIPAGFTFYKLTGTPITFDSPTAWGIPTATAEPGFSKRGGTNKSDGTYAYVISFPSNKDVEIAVTSGKFLPPARGATYYDFLQVCIGSADGKFYKSILHFTTDSSKVDTPTTVTCDQGPLADATKIDDTSLVQLKTKAPDGKTVIGDLYTKNLTDKDLVVMRVKDATMTHGQDIKTLLNTVKITSSGQ